MKLSHHSSIVAACVLALAALGTAAAQAGPAEDTARAETMIRTDDVVSAMGLLRSAANQNYAPAQARLADMLRAAEAYPEAIELYRKAADQNDPAGEVGLGRMYADGYGVQRDPEKALELYRKAQARNHWQAFDILARAYRAGDLGLGKDLAKAQELEAQAKALMPAKDAPR